MNYEQQVYAGVLGKVIGVYMGRPFEGWSKAAIQERFGSIDGYVHEDLDKPLIVADDDITGTFTFVRALEDSGLGAETPCAFFGDTWLNYIIEGKSILWWGGMAHSTEHTAFLRLQDGIKAPASGSMERNGRVVAEQIGAQIFIDAIGMCCPGDPARAAALARRAARVSHDGEAVHAAVVVAAMCAQAFVCSDMNALLDCALTQIPAESLIARIHREVRAWAAADGDWERTFARIDEAYGYHRYGGNCHVIPNHAIMVMAWAYAGDDFYEAQRIINTAGWDTDCNAANVGSVMGIALGLEAIDARYPFRAPVADRLLMPTADGSRSVSDCLIEARAIAAIGRRVMGMEPAPAAPTWQHFAEPGAVHGWQAEANGFAQRGTCVVSNQPHPTIATARCLEIEARVSAGTTAVASTPLLFNGSATGYAVDGCPRIWPGTEITVCVADCRGQGRLQPFLRYRRFDEETCREIDLADLPCDELPTTIRCTVPDDLYGMAIDLGLRFTAPAQQTITLQIAGIDFGGRAIVDLPEGPKSLRWNQLGPGWLHDLDGCRGPFSDDTDHQTHLFKNRGRALCVTGGRDWADSSITASIGIHGGDAVGLVCRYQGRERYYALRQSRTTLALIKRHYGEDLVLATCPRPLATDTFIGDSLSAKGHTITIRDPQGAVILEAVDDSYADGGCGLLIEQANINVRDLRIEAALAAKRY